jgi:hypothetical protein
MPGQANIEFLIVLIGVLLLSYVLIIAHGGQMLNLLQSENSVESMKSAYTLASAINYVYLAGDGSRYNFVFQVGNGTARAYSGFVEVRTLTGLSSAPLLTRNVVATEVTRGNHTIRNVRGVITIE